MKHKTVDKSTSPRGDRSDDAEDSISFACSAAPLEKGQVSWHTLAAGLKKVGCDAWISFEDFSEGRDTRTKLAYNLGYMKGVVGE